MYTKNVAQKATLIFKNKMKHDFFIINKILYPCEFINGENNRKTSWVY